MSRLSNSHDRRSPDQALRVLPRYALTIVLLALLTHVLVALMPEHALLVLALGTGAIAIALAVTALAFGAAFARLRFGAAILHALTYATVIGGNLLHLLISLAAGPADPAAVLGTWFGPTIAMGGLWGLGLLLHLVGSALSRGIEADTAPAPLPRGAVGTAGA